MVGNPTNLVPLPASDTGGACRPRREREGVLGQAEDYLARAQDAERMAAAITFEPDRQRMLDIAKGWRRLADQAAPQGPSAPSPPDPDKPQA
jgi:hypothetical protein